jgi:hypothetical protein
VIDIRSIKIAECSLFLCLFYFSRHLFLRQAIKLAANGKNQCSLDGSQTRVRSIWKESNDAIIFELNLLASSSGTIGLYGLSLHGVMAKHGGKASTARVIWAGSDILFDIQIYPPVDEECGEDGESQCVKKHVSNIFDCCSSSLCKELPIFICQRQIIYKLYCCGWPSSYKFRQKYRTNFLLRN